MAAHRTLRRDVLGELLEEARWVEQIGSLGRQGGPVSSPELDALLEALVHAEEQRRRWTEALARERERAPGGDWRGRQAG